MHDPLPSFPPARTLACLSALYRRLDVLASLPSAALLEPVPGVSAWSLGAHLFHVSLANELSLKNALALVRRRGSLIRACRGVPAPAVEVLRRGRIPRGATQAPRLVRPPEPLGAETVLRFYRQSRAALEEARPEAAAMEAALGCIPHHQLGDLGASAWLRFARLHTAHHLVIMRAIAAARTRSA